MIYRQFLTFDSWTRFTSVSLDPTALVSRFVARFFWTSRPQREFGYVSTIQALTPSIVDELSTGELKDQCIPGLRICVPPSGKKVWKYIRRVESGEQTIRLSLGSYPTFSIASAREWAFSLNDKVEAGIDPREEMRQQERVSKTRSRSMARPNGSLIEAISDRLKVPSSGCRRPNRQGRRRRAARGDRPARHRSGTRRIRAATGSRAWPRIIASRPRRRR
jgi:hypothetical protein